MCERIKRHHLQLASPSFGWPCALGCPVANQMLTIDFHRHSRTYRRLWAKELSMGAIPVAVVSDCLDAFRLDPIAITVLNICVVAK